MRKVLSVVGLTLALTSSAMAACQCIRYKERVAIDNYAVRHGHFYVTSCKWHGGRYDILVCRARRPTECYFAQPNSAGLLGFGCGSSLLSRFNITTIKAFVPYGNHIVVV